MTVKKKRTAAQIAATKKLVALNKAKRAGASTRKKNPAGLSPHLVDMVKAKEITAAEAKHWMTLVRKGKGSFPTPEGIKEAYAAKKRIAAKRKARAKNPEIHVDIDSHNTGGRNVRAKNPRSKKFIMVLIHSQEGKEAAFFDGIGFNTRKASRASWADLTAVKNLAKTLKAPNGFSIGIREDDAKN